MNKFIRNSFAMIVLICAWHIAVHAQAPSTISYQGRLTNTSGEPITSSQQVTFSIYPSPSSPAVLWSEMLLVTPDVQGVFTVVLGTQTPLQGTLFNGGNRYISLKVGSDNEMLPRQLFTSVPYAISTTNIPDGSVTPIKIETGAVTTNALADDAVTTAKIADNSIISDDQLDEAGLVYKMSLPANQFQQLPQVGTDNLDSITINAPAAGYIQVWAMTNIKLDHINGSRDWLWCQIAVVPDTIIPNSYGFAMIDIPADLPSNSSYIYPVNIHRPFQVFAAGSYTYYFNAKLFSGSGNNDEYHSLQMTAMFFPTAYGIISQSPPPNDDDENDTRDPKTKID